MVFLLRAIYNCFFSFDTRTHIYVCIREMYNNPLESDLFNYLEFKG